MKIGSLVAIAGYKHTGIIVKLVNETHVHVATRNESGSKSVVYNIERSKLIEINRGVINCTRL